MDENRNVPELFGTLEQASGEKKWYVIHTKSRCEKKLAKWALLNQIEYYLPLYDSFKVYKNKKVHFFKVLIPGYFFTKCNYSEKETLVRAGHTANFLTVKNEKELVDDLYRIYRGKLPEIIADEHPYLEKGYKVKINSGPLIGLEGIVENIDNPEKIVLNVTMLRKAVSITLPACNFEIIKEISDNEEKE